MYGMKICSVIVNTAFKLTNKRITRYTASQSSSSSSLSKKSLPVHLHVSSLHLWEVHIFLSFPRVPHAGPFSAHRFSRRGTVKLMPNNRNPAQVWPSSFFLLLSGDVCYHPYARFDVFGYFGDSRG